MNGARRCLEAIQNPALPAAAARLVAPLRAAGTAQALLEYLPYADDNAVVTEIESALTEVARRKDRLDRDLQAALQDNIPLRRAAAAVAICQGAGTSRAELVRKLLHDPKPTVRLRVALALGALSDEEAITVLIALPDELPPYQAAQALGFLSALAGEGTGDAQTGPSGAGRRKHRADWAEWWRQASSGELLAYFRRRTLTDADQEQIQTLVRQLGDDAFEVREKATAALSALGSRAAPLLRQAARSNDTEVVERAQKCLHAISHEKGPFTPAAAARLLAVRKPPEAAAVLLGYLPFADDEATVEAMQRALLVVGVRENKPDAAVLQALEDKQALRRAVAAETICKSIGADEPAVRRLLKDPVATVRLRVALALAVLKVRESIPVLIDLAADVSLEQAWQAQELLQRLAGEHPPTLDFGATPAKRSEARDTWLAWWKVDGARLDLAKLDGSEHQLGYILLVQADARTNTGRVGEWGPDGKLRWEITGLRFPADAQLLPGNRVLIAEQFGMLVSERDLKGNILWQKPVTMPVNCQRLPNGNTFIASRNLLLEVDRDDRQVLSYSRPAHDLLSAVKLRDGQIICLTAGGMCLRLDAGGKEVGSFFIGGTLGGLEALAGGNFVVAQPMNNRLVEFRADGKIVRQVAAQMPNSATFLPNGHVLVTSQAFTCVQELDRAGKVVWEMKTEGRPIRARKR
jgi:HEAT repeat protein